MPTVSEKDVLKLVDRVQTLTENMDELEYDKQHALRIRNVVMRELGKRAADLKTEPFEVMLEKVRKSAEATLKKELGEELNVTCERIIIELISDFRNDFSKKVNEMDKENAKRVKKVEEDVQKTTEILEKKVAMAEDELLKQSRDLEKEFEKVRSGMGGVVNEIKSKLQAQEASIEQLTTDKTMKTEISKLRTRVNKDLDALNDKVKEFEKSIKSLDEFRDEMKKSISEINQLQKDINTIRSGISKAPSTTDIKKLEAKVSKIETKPKHAVDLDRVEELERLVMKALGPQKKVK